MDRIDKYWSPFSAALIELMAMVGLGIAFLYFKIYDSSYFQFGPSESLVIFDVVLDNWEKLITAFLFATVLQSIVSTTDGVIGAWQITDVNNQYVAETKYGLKKTIFISVIHYIFGAVNWLISLKTDFYNVQFFICTSIPDFINYIFLIGYFKYKKNALHRTQMLEALN